MFWDDVLQKRREKGFGWAQWLPYDVGFTEPFWNASIDCALMTIMVTGTCECMVQHSQNLWHEEESISLRKCCWMLPHRICPPLSTTWCTNSQRTAWGSCYPGVCSAELPSTFRWLPDCLPASCINSSLSPDRSKNVSFEALVWQYFSRRLQVRCVWPLTCDCLMLW